MNTDALLRGLVGSLIFSGVGLVVFVVGLSVLKRVLPFDMHKELETDHNTAVGLVVGAFILGLALIIAAAIHG